MSIREKSNLRRNTVTSILFKFTTFISSFIVPRLFLSAYGSNLNGLVDSITYFLNIVSFLELGVGSVVCSALYKPLAKRDYVCISRILSSAQNYFNKLGAILVLYVTILAFIYPIVIDKSQDFFYTAILIGSISISMFAQFFFGIVNALLLTSDQKGYIVYNVQIVSIVLNTIVCYLMIEFGQPIHMVKLLSSIIFLVRPIYLAYYVKRTYPVNMNIDYQEEPIKQKWNGMAQHMASVIQDSIVVVMLSFFTNLSFVSVFSVYNLVVFGMRTIVISLTNGVEPLLGNLWANGDKEKLRTTFAWTEWSLNTLVTILFSITGIMLIPFVELYTEGINDINYIVPIFALMITISNMLHCLRLPYNLMILAAGHYKETQTIYIVAAILNIFITLIGVKLWGINGVCLGMICALIYQIFSMTKYNERNLVMWPIRKVVKQMFTNIIVIFFAAMYYYMVPLRVDCFIAWIFKAVQTTLYCCIVSVLINKLQYSEFVNGIFRRK